jgi:predicted small lipoprotein YifL
MPGWTQASEDFTCQKSGCIYIGPNISAYSCEQGLCKRFSRSYRTSNSLTKTASDLAINGSNQNKKTKWISLNGGIKMKKVLLLTLIAMLLFGIMACKPKVEEPPVEEAPVEEVPVEEVPAEEVPAEEAPAEAPATK